MDHERLVMMANQIAAFHRRKPRDAAVEEIAQHLHKFWEPRMRTAIREFVDRGGEGLDENARDAVMRL